MRYLIVALSVASAVGASAAQRSVAADGRVVDAISLAALPRVRVAVVSDDGRPGAVFTDDAGVFSLGDVPAGARIRFSKAGYAALDLLPTRIPSTVRLARAASVSGRVLEMGGLPLADAQVRLHPAVPSAGGQARDRSVETNDIGEFRFGGLEEGRYEVTVVRPFLTPARPVAVQAGEDLGGLEFPMALPMSCGAEPADREAVRLGRTASLSGRITSTAGAPIACAEVRAVRTGEPLHVTSTDADGRFLVTGLSAGAYEVEARKPGYGSRRYGQRGAGQSGAVLAIRDGQQLSRVDMALGRGSAVLGTVVDERGEPIESVKIRALQVRVMDGRSIGLPLGAAVTDDRGQYRLPGLLPGRYLVSALEEAVISGGTAPAGYAPTFYPGVADAASATPITIEEERDRPGIDLVYRPVAAVRIAGVATTIAGAPADAVLLMVSQRSGGIMVEPRTGDVRADGTFAITNVPPGDYVLQAIARRQGSRPEFGIAYLTVTESVPPPVAIDMRPMSTVRGRILVEGQGAAPGDFLLAPFPTDYDRSFAVGSGFPMSMGRDGTFQMENVTGPRRLTLLGAPDGWYLKSATLDGADTVDSPFDFGLEGHAHEGLEVVVSSQGAGLNGDVLDASDRSVGSYVVVVFSTQRDFWFRNSRHVKFARADQNNRFTINGLPPGTYWAAALQQVEGNSASGEWQDPAFLEVLSSSARRVELHEGEHVVATLRLSPR